MQIEVIRLLIKLLNKTTRMVGTQIMSGQLFLIIIVHLQTLHNSHKLNSLTTF